MGEELSGSILLRESVDLRCYLVDIRRPTDLYLPIYAVTIGQQS